MDAGDAVTIAEMLPRRVKRALATTFVIVIVGLDYVSTELAQSAIRSTTRLVGYAYCQHVRGEMNDLLAAAAPEQPAKIVCRR